MLHRTPVFNTALQMGTWRNFAGMIHDKQVGILARHADCTALRRSAENFTDRRIEDDRPVYEVRCGAQAIEFSRSIKDAYSAYTPAAYPCEIVKIEHGLRRVIERKSPPTFHKG